MSFYCKYKTGDDQCQKILGRCRPGVPGCVLYGKVVLSETPEPPEPKASQSWRTALTRAGWPRNHQRDPLDRGNGSQLAVLTFSDGRRLVLKTLEPPEEDLPVEEARSLSLIRSVQGGPRVPETVVSGPGYLVTEYLAPGSPSLEGWKAFGKALARMHKLRSPVFGGVPDNHLGASVQTNRDDTDGWKFFSEQRLMPQVRRAFDSGLLETGSVEKVENICRNLKDLIPPQDASLIHGDLWSGNIHPLEDGTLALLDPAAHYGWPEADLAMAHLFGTLPREFWDGYLALRPLEDGFHERFSLYNLYHLLNHLNLFGSRWLPAVREILDRWN